MALSFVVAIFSTPAPAQPQPPAYPGKSWETAKNPDELGWSTEKLQQARAYAETINTAAVMIVQSGIVVDAWGETTRKFNVHSVRKSLLSAMIGIYENHGTLRLDSTLEELRIDDRLGLTKSERRARLIDLLASRSGIYHPANLVGEDASKSWPERGSHTPGTHWFYSNWDFNATGAIFEKETGRGIFEVFDELIAQPIGMQDYGRGTGCTSRGAVSAGRRDGPCRTFRLTFFG